MAALSRWQGESIQGGERILIQETNVRVISAPGSLTAGRKGDITGGLVACDENVGPSRWTMNNPNGRLPQRMRLMMQGCRSMIIIQGTKVDSIILGRDNMRVNGTYGLRILKNQGGRKGRD